MEAKRLVIWHTFELGIAALVAALVLALFVARACTPPPLPSPPISLAPAGRDVVEGPSRWGTESTSTPSAAR